jgi:hypothetical protein
MYRPTYAENVRMTVIRILTGATTRDMTVYKVAKCRHRWAAIRFLYREPWNSCPHQSVPNTGGSPSHLYLPAITADTVPLSNHLTPLAQRLLIHKQTYARLITSSRT